MLQDLVYCLRCLSDKPEAHEDERFGKMRPAWDGRYQRANYRCLARDRGYSRCQQGHVRTKLIDKQVVDALINMKLGEEHELLFEKAVRQSSARELLTQKLVEIQEIVARIDFSWDQGLLSPEIYMAKRQALLEEMALLQKPVETNYDEVAELIENFAWAWQRTESVATREAAQQALINKVVERVVVLDELVVAIHLVGGICLALVDLDELSDDDIGGLMDK